MHRTTAELEAQLDVILQAPTEVGLIEMLVRRPDRDQRESVEKAELSTDSGLVGDNWIARTGEDGNPHPDTQLTLMNSRVIDVLAGTRERWPLAGDQVYVDMDLSTANLPPGSRIRVGDAVVEISEVPHTGCEKFASRYGKDALRFANVGVGRENRFRGVNAFVVESGTVRVGDKVSKI
ncbi:MAG TPA: MOSC domain-containing protein [Acidimicrobiia bacterium]